MLDSISFFRVIKSGLTNFARNPWLSAAATMVMTITLVIFSTLFLLFILTNSSINTIQNTVDVSVYFKIGLAEEQINKIQNEIQTDPRVKEVTYVSAAQAFEDFKLKHKDDPAVSQSLNELTENLLPATLHVKANRLEDYQAISDNLNGDNLKNFIDKANFEDNREVIERLNKILGFIITFGIAIVAVFGLIAVLVIFNTITLTIYNRKEEVEIMRLVGATNWYIRGPFLTESILYSILAALLTVALFVPVMTKILPKVAIYISASSTIANPPPLVYVYMGLGLLVLALLLSVVSTLLAIRKYLKI